MEALWNDDRRARLRALFDAAQQWPPEQRAELLLDACPSDPELCAEVETLLNAGGSGFLENPPVLSTVDVGTKLGIFELKGRVGHGGMGEVWRAHDPRLKRDVAIKVLPTILAIDPDRVARFEREARAASALNHPNIVSVFDIGHENGIYWIVSELIDGESLRDRMSRGMMEQRRALAIATCVANGLAAAHAAGLVHRDLKPGNIMLHRDGRVKLVDFGLAKTVGSSLRTEEMTDSGVILGTAGYMAPEQVRGENTDPRADVFSFGVVLYEMLSGRQAFSGASAVDQLHAILKEEPPPLPALVPPTLDRVVRRCLEKDPGLRFQSAADLAFTLDSLPPALPHSATQPIVKSRGVIPWIAFAAALAVAAGLGFLQLTRPLPAPRVLGVKRLTPYSSLLMPVTEPLLSDGTRLLTWLSATKRAVQVSVKGGEPVPIDLRLGNYASLLDISPDRSEFLICRDPDLKGFCQLWVGPNVGAPYPLLSLETRGRDSASWSPDGKFLVYSTGGDIFLATRGGVNLRKLASFPHQVAYFPRWSPDSSKIRFTVAIDNNYAVYNQIFEVRPDGTDLHSILPDWYPTSRICCGVWTPDGQYFVFLANQKIWAVREKAGFLRYRTDKPNILEVGDMDAFSPVPSADGKRLFFQGVRERMEYQGYDLLAGQLTSEWFGMAGSQVEFSRDGKYISFVSPLDGTLFKAAADGTQRVQLTWPPLKVSLPRWSPDGKQLAFFSNDQRIARRVYVVSADGGTAEQVTHGESGGGDDIDPSWSPNGNSLAFGSHDTKSEKQSIRVLDRRTGRISELAGSSGMWSPRWSPDGRSIAGLSREGKLMLYDLQTKRQTVLLNESTEYPNWSKDGKFLFCDALQGDVAEGWWRVDIQQKKADRIKSPQRLVPDREGWFTIAPDGSLITLRLVGSVAIYALDLDLP